MKFSSPKERKDSVCSFQARTWLTISAVSEVWKEERMRELIYVGLEKEEKGEQCV